MMGKRELVPLLNLSSWCLVEHLFLAVPRCCLWFLIVVFPDHTHLLFFISLKSVCRHIVIGDCDACLKESFQLAIDYPNTITLKIMVFPGSTVNQW